MVPENGVNLFCSVLQKVEDFLALVLECSPYCAVVDRCLLLLPIAR